MLKHYKLIPAICIVVLVFFDLSAAQCPQDPRDLGICDTLYVEVLDCDHVYEGTGGYDSVRVAIYVTHDSNTFWWEGGNKWVQDSLLAFVTPLTFWHQRPGCADSVVFPTWDNWNNTIINPYDTKMSRSMFRHIVDSDTGDTLYNRMLQMVENGKDPWSVVTVSESHSSDGDSGHAFFAALPLGDNFQVWWEGSRVLLATLTFLVYMSEDCYSTQICLDSTFWPQSSHLTFTRWGAVTYYPRHFLPVCDTIYVGFARGDCNGDGVVNIADVVYLVTYLFAGGPAPEPLEEGDATCDGVVNIADAVYLVTYLFLGGPPPFC